MPFLTIEELRTVIPEDVQQQMVGDAQLEQIIAEEQAKMASYLQARYDTEALFGAEGEDRNLAVLAHLKSMVLASLYTVNGRALNEVAQAKMEEAMRWLEGVASGKLTPQLPRRNADQDGRPDSHLVLGSKRKYDTSI